MNLDTSFERDAGEALLDEAEHHLVGKQDNLIHQTVQRSHDVLEANGQRHDYNVGPVIDSFDGVDVQRSGRELTITYGWSHPAAPYFSFGTSDHTVEGDPILSFIWEDAPQGVREMFPNTERQNGDPRVFFESVDVAGLPESRFMRTAIEWLRAELR